MSLYDDLLDLIPVEVLDISGSTLYSGREAFECRSPLYLLGFNPGGSPETVGGSIRENAEASRVREDREWSEYLEGEWLAGRPGEDKFQRRVRHLLDRCGLDARTVPSSNALFPRSSVVATLVGDEAALLDACWPVHEKAIREMGTRVVVCFGKKAAAWIRAKTGATELVDEHEYRVRNSSKVIRSTTHRAPGGLLVVQLTHPSRFNWVNPVIDPTGLVVRALAGYH